MRTPAEEAATHTERTYKPVLVEFHLFKISYKEFHVGKLKQQSITAGLGGGEPNFYKYPPDT